MKNFRRKQDKYSNEMLCFLNSLARDHEDIARPFMLYVESFCQPSYKLKHLLSARTNYPIPELHFWLIDDYAVNRKKISRQFEKNIFLAAMFYSVYILFDNFINKYFANPDSKLMAIRNLLKQRGDSYILSSFPAAHKIRNFLEKFWKEYFNARAAVKDHTGKLKLFSKAEQQKISQGWSPAKLPVIAVALKIGQNKSIPALIELLNNIHFLVQTRQDIMNIQRDISRHYYSYPIMRIIIDSGMSLRQTPDFNAIIGGLLLRDSVQRIAAQCIKTAEETRKTALSLGLKNFACYTDSLKKSFHDILDLFLMKNGRAKTCERRFKIETEKNKAAFALDYIDELPRSINRAKSYLLSDDSFRECVEIHTWGLLGAPLLTGRVFPLGIVLENLCACGLDMSRHVDELFENYAKNDFHYYNELCPLPPDIDILGLMLRLRDYSNDKTNRAILLNTPIRWLRANVLKSGDTPVWIRKNIDAIAPREYFSEIAGKSCSAASAGLLLGLIKYSPPDFLPLIKKIAAYQLKEFIKYGSAKSAYYKPLYFYWLVSEILSSPIVPDLAPKNLIIKSLEKLARLIKKEKKETNNTAQDAAFLTLACLNKGFEHLFDPDWITQIVKSQRFDGSWNAENIYCFLTQDYISGWYSSRLVTTSYCYRALSAYTAQKNNDMSYRKDINIS